MTGHIKFHFQHARKPRYSSPVTHKNPDVFIVKNIVDNMYQVGVTYFQKEDENAERNHRVRKQDKNFNKSNANTNKPTIN